MYVRTTNVLRFSVALSASRATGSLILHGTKVLDIMSLQDQSFSLSESGAWIVIVSEFSHAQSVHRLNTIFIARKLGWIFTWIHSLENTGCL